MFDDDEDFILQGTPEPMGLRSAAVLAVICIFIAVLLSGCSGKPERTIGLVDPVSGCKWVATQYGDGFTGGNYVKPQTDSNGKQICEKGGV